MKIALPANDLSECRLRRYVQMGVEAVTVPHRLQTTYLAQPPKPLVPPAGTPLIAPQPAPPDVAELRQVCDHVRRFGLDPIATALALCGDVLTGGSGRDAELARFCEGVRVIGDAGIGVITTNFTVLRASEGYGSHHNGRGGAQARDFDADRQAGLPVLEDLGVHTADDMWDRLDWFLQRAVPVAAAAGVRFALHPNDPPVEVFRGVAQPLCNLAAMQRLVQQVDDPANSIYYDSGVATEWGQDAVEVAHWFAGRDRIGLAHIRNVRVQTPGLRYTEGFVDDGDADIAAVLRVLHECGYTGGIDPDHTPGFTMDEAELWIGWAYAIGALRGCRP